MRAVLHKLSYQRELLETLGALFIASIIAIPIFTIFYIAFTADDNIWPHLASTVLPGYITTTFIVLVGISVITVFIGVGLAWIITVYEFPMRRVMEWLCLIPLAMPAYIVAYAYGDLLDYTGFVQSSMRLIFGWARSKIIGSQAYILRVAQFLLCHLYFILMYI